MRVAACQMVSGIDLQDNIRRARALINSAVESGAELVVLPQYFSYMPAHERELLAVAESFGNGPVQQAMSEVARKEQIWLVAGSIALKTDDAEHFIDASLLYSPSGEVAARYDKIHLFNYEDERETYSESSVIQAGHKAVSTQIETWEGLWKLGLTVCFDLRFPELFRDLGTPDIITLPAAFTTVTGRAHWQTLVRARAIENQCYVIACAQGGTHECGRRTWGRSMVVDPWGQVVAELTEGEGVLLAEVTQQRIDKVRMVLPALQNRLI